MDIKEAIKLFVRREEAEVEEPPVDPSIKIKVKKTEKPIKIKIEEPIKVYMKIRKTLAGDYMIFDIYCMGPNGKIFNPPINLERRGCKYKMLSLVKKLQDQYGPGYQFFLTPVV